MKQVTYALKKTEEQWILLRTTTDGYAAARKTSFPGDLKGFNALQRANYYLTKEKEIAKSIQSVYETEEEIAVEGQLVKARYIVLLVTEESSS